MKNRVWEQLEIPFENEEWKPVVGYEGLYKVSNQGRVRSLPRNSTSGKILKLKTNTDGYLLATLYKDGKSKSYRVHRLVALAFIPNPNNLPEINHKSEEKWLNTVDNLEWCDRVYNINYGNRTKKTSKPVKQLTLNGELVYIWPSMAEAGRNGFNHQNICSCCQGKHKTAYGYKWKYV